MTSLLFSKFPQVKSSLAPCALQIAEQVEKYVKTAVYKCDRLSAENACECLFKLVQESPLARKHLFSNMLQTLSEYGTYMNTTDSMAKIYIL